MKTWTDGLPRTVAGCCFALQIAVTQAQTMASAMEHYAVQRYATAQQQLLALAREGEPAAREMLGFMYWAGPALFPGVAQDDREAVYWFSRAAQDGNPVARHMACRASMRLRDPVLAQRHCAP